MNTLVDISKQIQKLRDLKPGWDSYGGLKISDAAINAARQTLVANANLTPCSNGGVQIDWPNAELAFLPDGMQDFDGTSPRTSLATIRELALAMPHEPGCKADEEPCGAAAESGCEWPTIGCHTHSACTCHRGKILAAAGGAE